MVLLIVILQGCITLDMNNDQNVAKNTYYVSTDGSVDFNSIQEAINASLENYTIFILNGHYTENIFVNKSISIIGENLQKTIIDGGMVEDTVLIDANNVSLSNFTIINSGTDGKDSGIHILGNNVEIKNNIIYDNNIGIYTKNGRNNRIHNNIISSNKEYGLYAYTYSDHLQVLNNSFFKNDCSLRIKGSRYCKIIRNHFNNSYEGMYFCCGARLNTVYHNTFLNHTRWNANDLVGSNYWNNTNSEGNYWDDYDGVDKNNDGIGDTKYVISKNREIYDFFPLMNPK